MGHKNFLSTPIHLPNLDKQNSVTSDLNHIETLISRAIRAKQEILLNLNSLKFSILDRAFSGELTKDVA